MRICWKRGQEGTTLLQSSFRSTSYFRKLKAVLSKEFTVSSVLVFLKVFPLKVGRQFLSVTSFNGGCCVEVHVSYKTAVSSPELAGAHLPLAWPLKSSWRIYYYYLWSGST